MFFAFMVNELLSNNYLLNFEPPMIFLLKFPIPLNGICAYGS